MAQKEDDLLEAVHETALQRMNKVQSNSYDERKQSLEDRRFASIAGAQWEDELGAFFENKPKLEINKIAMPLLKLKAEYRKNRLTVDFVSKDGSDADELADIFDGLYRADEQNSVAQEAYDNSFTEASAGGFGSWRLRNDYEDEYDEENEYQRIFIEPIVDADTSVYWDPNSIRYDKSDANWCFVLHAITPETFKERYDEEAPVSVNKNTETNQFDWNTPDKIYIAEYYVKEIEEVVFVYYKSLVNDEIEKFEKDDLDEEDIAELEATDFVFEKERKIKRKKVHKYIMSGAKVLEDKGMIAGSEIPIVPLYFERWYIDNIERFRGLVRTSKDMQRLMNIQFSKLAEIASLSAVEKPYFAPEQIAGHENSHTNDNIDNKPYLLLNPLENEEGQFINSGPLGYTKPPQVPPALAVLIQTADVSIQELLGNPNQGEKVIAGTSGKLMGMVQDQLDLTTYMIMSNMEKSMKRCGEIWASMAPEVYFEDDRKLKTIGKQGEISTVTIGELNVTSDGEIVSKDLSDGKFDVVAESGPASSTKKKALIEALTEVMRVTTDQDLQSLYSTVIAMNIEGEGIGFVKDYARKLLVQRGVVDPTKEEAAEMQQASENAQPTAEETYLNAEASKSNALAQKAGADTMKTMAQTEKTNAETAEIIANMDIQQKEMFFKLLKELEAGEVQQTAVSVPPLQTETGE
jgi:hypothetical protein